MVIVFDTETRQFSAVDETKEFGIVKPLVIGGLGAAAIGGMIANKANKRRRRYERRDNRRTHRERREMIQAGMDPSTVEDYKTNAMRESYGYKNHKLDARTDRIDARTRRKAGSENFKLDRRRIIAPERTTRIKTRRGIK